MPKPKRELLHRDTTRNLGEELLQSVREMKAGQKSRVTKVSVSWVNEVRSKTGLSQNAFAKLLGISMRTLQDWEQGRREPSGPARTLLRITEIHPDILENIKHEVR